jgi:hypothetical protein
MKTLGQMNQNLVGSINGMSSMVKSKRMTDDGHQVMTKSSVILPLARLAKKNIKM